MNAMEYEKIHPRVSNLLDAIMQDDDGDGVVPIVGQGLLQVTVDWAQAFQRQPEIYARVKNAFRDELVAMGARPKELGYILSMVLAERLGLRGRSDVESMPLAQLVTNHPLFDSNRYEVDTELKQLYYSLVPDIPEPLRNLAKIQRLRFFISTTPDDLLERAINEERFDGQHLTRTLSFAPTRRPTDEKISQEIDSGYPVVFHLFGRLKSPACVALTESDFVDYIAALLDKESRPRRLFSELKGKHLLLVGNSFQDWLARFFLRLTKDSPLPDQSGGVQYVSDSVANDDNSLAFFVRRCAKKVELIDELQPPELLRQLALAFRLRLETGSATAALGAELDPYAIRSDWIFISYSRSALDGNESEDCLCAQRLAAKLKLEGFKIWLDVKRGLLPGDDYQKKIRLAIQRCGVFLPLCSRTTQMRGDTSDEAQRPFFRREWDWAIQRLVDIEKEDPSRKFILPVVLDDLPFERSNVPAHFKKFNAYSAPKGEAGQELSGELKFIVREINRREHVGV